MHVYARLTIMTSSTSELENIFTRVLAGRSTHGVNYAKNYVQRKSARTHYYPPMSIPTTERPRQSPSPTHYYPPTTMMSEIPLRHDSSWGDINCLHGRRESFRILQYVAMATGANVYKVEHNRLIFELLQFRNGQFLSTSMLCAIMLTFEISEVREVRHLLHQMSGRLVKVALHKDNQQWNDSSEKVLPW